MMTVFFIILLSGILSIVGQYFLVQKYGKHTLLSFFKVIAFVAVAVSCFVLVFMNPGLFKDSDGYFLAAFVSIFSPKVVDNALEVVFGKNEA